jgi:hypothetical protein
MNMNPPSISQSPVDASSKAAPPRVQVRPFAAGLMVALASLFRIFPTLKPENVAPVGALALFGGARLPLWQAFVMQFICMAISDLVLGMFFGRYGFDPFVYGSFAIYVLLGRLLRNTRSPWKVGSVSLLASLQFYLITNFGVWYSYSIYPPTLIGLLECYAAGLLFFGFTVAGDLGFSAVLFGAYDWLPRMILGSRRLPAEKTAT